MICKYLKVFLFTFISFVLLNCSKKKSDEAPAPVQQTSTPNSPAAVTCPQIIPGVIYKAGVAWCAEMQSVYRPGSTEILMMTFSINDGKPLISKTFGLDIWNYTTLGKRDVVTEKQNDASYHENSKEFVQMMGKSGYINVEKVTADSCWGSFDVILDDLNNVETRFNGNFKVAYEVGEIVKFPKN